MLRRGILLIFFSFIILSSLSATVVYDLFASVSQGFNVFGFDDFDIYRAPTGAGAGIRVSNFWHSITFGGDITWYGFPPMEDEISFGDSWMITGLLSAGWIFPLLADGKTQLAFVPRIGAGFYTRSITWDSSTVRASRPVFQFSIDGILKTEESLLIGASINITGFMDNQPIWGLSLDIDIGYRFGGDG